MIGSCEDYNENQRCLLMSQIQPVFLYCLLKRNNLMRGILLSWIFLSFLLRFACMMNFVFFHGNRNEKELLHIKIKAHDGKVNDFIWWSALLGFQNLSSLLHAVILSKSNEISFRNFFTS